MRSLFPFCRLVTTSLVLVGLVYSGFINKALAEKVITLETSREAILDIKKPEAPSDFKVPPKTEVLLTPELDTKLPLKKIKAFDADSLFHYATDFFGMSAETLAEIIDLSFARYGMPTAIIRGEEIGASMLMGLRYGKGELAMQSGETSAIHWRGPSLGIDAGGHLSKSFILVYGLEEKQDLFQRFSGIDAALYYVGGVGVNYLQRKDMVLVPIRVGVGGQIGLSVGYMKLSEESGWNPF